MALVLKPSFSTCSPETNHGLHIALWLDDLATYLETSAAHNDTTEATKINHGKFVWPGAFVRDGLCLVSRVCQSRAHRQPT